MIHIGQLVTHRQRGYRVVAFGHAHRSGWFLCSAYNGIQYWIHASMIE